MDIFNIEDKLFYDIKKQRYRNREPIDRMMMFFNDARKSKDLEISSYAKEVYEYIGWGKNDCFDVINSFWTTFSSGLVISNYDLMSQNKIKKIYYSFDRDNNTVKMMRKSTYSKYYFERNEYSDFKKIIRNLKVSNRSIDKLAEVSHTITNFMPCPKGFNQAKGCCSEVKDYLPLMVDKIEECISSKKTLQYITNENKISVLEIDLKAWKKWLIDSRENFSLEEYYDYDKEREMLIGRKLFKTQSLKNPLPRTSQELEECIEEIINRNKNRGNKILSKYKLYINVFK